jgi:pimeloyl-ACP methyl ester carboxylesterase
MGSPATVEGHVEVPGGRIWYRIAGADRPGTPVLCLHGGPGMPHDYLEPLEDLAVNRPVVFYDQLGCGRSGRPADDSLWTTDRFVEELAVVHAVLGLKRPHLFGNSWGGCRASARHDAITGGLTWANLVRKSAGVRGSGDVGLTVQLRAAVSAGRRACRWRGL